MADSNNVAGNKNFRNVWLVSGTPTMLIPAVGRVYAEIFNESAGYVRVGNPSGMMTLPYYGVGLPSGTYVYDSFSSDDWWAIKVDGGTSGSMSAFWVEGL